MALINCPECSAQVSTKAIACPQCGAPIQRADEAAAVGTPLQTVQQTSKRLKSHILIAAALFWGGLLLRFSAARGDAGISIEWPNWMIVAGLALYIVTKMRIWWHHK